MNVFTRKGLGEFQQVVTAGKHQILSDLTIAEGGGDTGMTPHELIQAALASCTTITVLMYAKRKGWALNDIRADVDLQQNGSETVFNLSFHFAGDLDDEQRARLTEIAKKCPIHRLLSGKITVNSLEK